MSTAAVIGRQLRHHQPTNRVPGPVVPPTHYRGADPESKFAKFSHQYNHSSYEYYPHPAHRENNQNQNKNQNKNDKRNLQKLSTTNNNDTDEDQNQSNDQWVFSKHCFCVAFKALSTGVILFLIGTIMSILGFFADRLSMESIRLNNGTYIMSVNNNTKSHLHNMTYVGPVIMGLGFIVIIAACVLTFEVRDTLGIRDDPKNRKKSTTTTTTTNQQQSDNKTNNDSIVTISNYNNQRNYSKNLKSEKKVISAPIIEETLSKNQSINHDHNNNNNNDNRLSMIKTDSNVNMNMMMINPSNLTCSSCSSPYYYSNYDCYCRIPSPVDIELSDPEGCSSLNQSITNFSSSTTTLPTPTNRKWRQRCSCSGSPTNSMLLALNQIVDQIDSSQYLQQPRFDKRFSHKQQQLSINQNNRMIASIEDLSSINSYQSDNNDDDGYRCWSTTTTTTTTKPTSSSSLSLSLPQKSKQTSQQAINLWPDTNVQHINTTNMVTKPIYQMNNGNNHHHHQNTTSSSFPLLKDLRHHH